MGAHAWLPAQNHMWETGKHVFFLNDVWCLLQNHRDGAPTGDCDSRDHGPDVPDMMADDPDSGHGQSSLNDGISFTIYNAHVLV
jgi:hypothetical protein